MSIPGISGIIRDLEKERAKEKPLITGRKPQFQCGVLRTNCIDCLDRTNVAQYAYGLEALGRQLNALGYSDALKIDSDSGVATALMDMYQNMGDALALQYGGSAAHNTVFPERQGKWKATTQSKEFLKSIKRYYSNTYTDGEKQYAINLFLGHFQPQEGKPALWDLDSDYYLHLGGFADEISNEASRVGQNPSLNKMFQQNLSGAISALPAYRQDYRVAKLTSFEKLFQITCGPIKNVRLHNDVELRHGAGYVSGTAPDAAEVQLKSPNWLFGQRKPEEPNATKSETAQKPPVSLKNERVVREFSDFIWLAPLGPAEEEEAMERQLRSSFEDDLDWYGTLLLAGTVADSSANQHYEECCKSPLEGLAHIETSEMSDSLIMDDVSEEYAAGTKSDDIEDAMEAAMKGYEEIGDVASIMPGGGPSVEFTTEFAQWLFRRAGEDGEPSPVVNMEP